MKPYCCRLRMSSLAQSLLVVDIFRTMIVAPVLIGIFLGMACVQVHKFPEKVVPSPYNTERVHYYRNREVLVYCIVIGITFCAADILMALALDKILWKNLGRGCVIWLAFATLTLFIRNAFYGYVWKYEEELGLHRLDDLTPTVKITMRIVFMVCVAYEVVKVLELIVGLAAQREFEVKSRIVPDLDRVGAGQKRMLRLF